MKKIVLAILGLLSIGGIIQLLSTIYLSTVQVITIGSIVDPDALEISAWIIAPTILSVFLFFKLIKNPNIFNLYKRTFSYFIYGVITTLVISFILVAQVYRSGELMGLLAVIGIALIGLLISVVLSIVGFIVDRKKR